MKGGRYVHLGVMAVALLVALGLGDPFADRAKAARPAEDLAPRFRVDPFWPKPLPNKWILGQVAGVAVDSQDHVWIIQRPRTLTDDEKGATLTPPRSTCCFPAPSVMEFDAEGNFIQGWGGPGPGYEWPAGEHGIFVDHNDNVWIAGNAENDHQVLKFSRDGTFLMQLGRARQTGGDADTAHFGRPADTEVDPATDEVYVADGYRNHRVIVFDAKTGAYKRHWGANGRPPGDPSVKSFGNPVHCVRIAKDGLVYVCDRANNRIQVFRKDGTLPRATSSTSALPRRAEAGVEGVGWNARFPASGEPALYRARLTRPSANMRARSTATSFSAGSGAMGWVRVRRGIVVIVSRFTTQALGKPSVDPSATSVGIRRTRVVTGATVTSSRTA